MTMAAHIQSIHVHVEAALALDVHKVRVGRLYQALELVLALLLLGRRVQEINIACEHLWMGKYGVFVSTQAGDWQLGMLRRLWLHTTQQCVAAYHDCCCSAGSVCCAW